MPAVPISRNRIRLPVGYRSGSSSLRSSIPGYALPKVGPGRNILGATQNFTVASVPADLSTLIVNAPDGKAYTFQFVYNTSVQTLGIKIPLPLSGASTAAQVATAVLGVVGLSGGTPISGPAVIYPWVTATPVSAHFELDYTVNGAAGAPTGTQATITVVTTAPNLNGSTSVLPGMFGKAFTLLPGF